MPPEARPHLPRKFLDKLIADPCMKDKKSFIFSKEFHTTRLKLADHNQTAVNAESHIAGFSGGFFKTTDEDRHAASASTSKQLSSNRCTATAAVPKELYEDYSFLHMAVDDTDPPLACEMIRHGTLIDTENAKGQTPLMQALERIWDLHSVLKRSTVKGPLPPTMQGYKTQIENAQNRVRYIAVILIGQHANVNATVNWQGKVVSSLHLACATDDWDLVSLLLEHGAESEPTPTCVDVDTFLVTAASKRRLKGLKANAKATRPLRICPCFSGEPMSECHSKRLPYPDDFTCSCGSGKVYEKCCKARNIRLTEIWDEETKWIQPSRTVSLPNGPPSFASPEVHAVMEQFKQNGDMEKVMKMVPEAMFNPEVREVFDECLELGCQENIADPAFTFAYFETKYFPSPQGRSSSKHWCRQKQKEWNAAVDKYIESGVDSRPRSEIEEAAKIGISLGAMYRACEADGCDKVEGRDIEKMLTCARCKMTFYCGAACQKAHWRTHKPVCGSVEQTERPLPSQVALGDFVCKFSPALMMYRMGDPVFDGLKLDDLKSD
ncbi:hypothetical protein B0H17DRAFT_1131132 [Mycena rosella]|uniref:MYND-type domain-containing protein n=1 Tax=Mycena rosella TaxID=1033263 RepID=A0AAD7GL18_MYCRO|nr:hypothetical protein B0H17DRAFT_1131132 [Mycena rosella]